MKRYILMRILRSLFSIFMVTTLTYAIIFSLVPRRLIFQQDGNYTKMTTTPDRKANYENTIYERMGYIDYLDTAELQKAASEQDSSVTREGTEANKKIYQKYLASLGSGWELKQFTENKEFYATREIPLLERVWKFYANLIVVDHPWKIKDPSNPNLKRYLHFENDPAIGWSLVGSGTEHKYLLYFNDRFPYVHQNLIGLNLGISYPTYQGTPVLDVLTSGQGRMRLQQVHFPTGVTRLSAVDIYSRTYRSPNLVDSHDASKYGAGDAYTETKNNYQDPSMITNSFIAGIFGVILSYLFGLPLGMIMARYKDKAVDRFSTATMTFLLALPSIATIYIIRSFGGSLGLPDTFPLLGAGDWRSYALPAIILAILTLPSIVIWFRRYLVDLQGSDFVRFARAKGLSESEISRKHLFKQAMVPIINGIPAAIIGTIVGATLTETIFAFPGMGKMLIDAIRSANNAMVVGLVFLFTTLAIVSLLIGDILMTVLDPRIKLSTKKGGK